MNHIMASITFATLQCLSIIITCQAKPSNSIFQINMPDAKPLTGDEYQCAVKMIPSSDGPTWIKSFAPTSKNPVSVSTISLYGCEKLFSNTKEEEAWNCLNKGFLCENPQLIFRWQASTPSVELPKDVGFKIGQETSIKFLLIRVHYDEALPEGQSDRSGLSLTLTDQQQKLRAGVLEMFSGMGMFTIPPHEAAYEVDLSCVIHTPQDITLFASQAHTHSLGVVVSGYYVAKVDKTKMTEIGKINPHVPQGFFPLEKPVVIQTDDVVTTKCVYNSTNKGEPTVVGSFKTDEICEMLFMYYTNEKGNATLECGMNQIPSLSQLYPESSRVALSIEDQRHNAQDPITYTSNGGVSFTVAEESHLEEEVMPEVDKELKENISDEFDSVMNQLNKNGKVFNPFPLKPC